MDIRRRGVMGHRAVIRGEVIRREVIKRGVIACIAVFLFVIAFMSRTMFTSMAREEHSATPYYKSIEIQEGDSLWGIAVRYKEGGPMDTGEYVNQLKEINGLQKDTIHAGQYLMVVYYE